MAIYYLGTFPPEYGGVTIKNRNLFLALEPFLPIQKVDFSEIKRRNMKELFRLILVLMNPRNRFVVGVAGTKTRKNFCKLLYYVNRKAMNRSIIMLMGGTVANDISKDPQYIRYVREFKRIYVETLSMKDTLEQCGLTNAGFYPNGRFRPVVPFPEKVFSKDPFRCVFFSLIAPIKGADIILETAKQLPEVSFSFYGVIDSDYRDTFDHTIALVPNAYYHGVFKGSADAVYQELGKYDTLLFPTKHIIEGVPGILVESKIAGIPAVVSNRSYNAEIVNNGMDGIVMDELSPQCLTEVIKYLSQNRDRLKEMGKQAQISAEQYLIENYVDELVNAMKEE